MFLFNCNYAILYYNITSYSPRQALIAPAVVYFYCLAGDSMHNMNSNSGLRAYCFIKIFIIMYQFKQDLAMAYFDGCSKKTAGTAETEWKVSLLVFPK